MINLEALFLLMRDGLGRTQAEVAKVAGVAQAALSQFEHGQTSISIDTLRRIAPSLALNPKFLTNETQNPFKSSDLIKLFQPRYHFSSLIYSHSETPFFPLQLLVDANETLEIVSLESSMLRPPDLDGMSRPYAIAVKDSIGNVFLLRNRDKEKKIVYAESSSIREEVLSYAETRKKDVDKIKFRSAILSDDLVSKITDWSISKREVERLIRVAKPSEGILPLVEKERQIISAIRKGTITADDILKHIKRKATAEGPKRARTSSNKR